MFHCFGHLNNSFPAVVIDAYRFPWRFASYRIVEIQITDVFSGRQDIPIFDFDRLPLAYSLPSRHGVLGIGKAHRWHEFELRSTNVHPISSTVGSDNQRRFYITFKRFDNDVYGLTRARAGYCGLDAEPVITYVHVIYQLARLQFDIANLQHCANDIHLLNAVDELDHSARRSDRAARAARRGLPALRNPNRLALGGAQPSTRGHWGERSRGGAGAVLRQRRGGCRCKTTRQNKCPHGVVLPANLVQEKSRT